MEADIMANVIYLQDYLPGVHCYTPEMGERKPVTKMEARLSHDGRHYFVDTPLELKGRGILENSVTWVDGCRKQLENWRSYRVTLAAFAKLEKQYSISMECLLD